MCFLRVVFIGLSLGIVPSLWAFEVETTHQPEIHIDISALNVLAGSLSATAQFGAGRHFSIGPVVGFHPLYLLTPKEKILAYDVGVESNIFIFGDRHTNSVFISPFVYHSGLIGYRIHQPSLHAGLIVGYRWRVPHGISFSVGAGAKTIMTWTEVYSYNPRGRVFMGSSFNILPITPSLKFSIGFDVL